MVFFKIELYTSLVCLKALGQSYYNKEPIRQLELTAKSVKLENIKSIPNIKQYFCIPVLNLLKNKKD